MQPINLQLKGLSLKYPLIKSLLVYYSSTALFPSAWKERKLTVIDLPANTHADGESKEILER